MFWQLSDKGDPEAVAIAGRHYRSRGAPFMPPGLTVVLRRKEEALWGVSWQRVQSVDHAWPGLLLCSIFHNEGDVGSSALIREALAATGWLWRWRNLPRGGVIKMLSGEEERSAGRDFINAGFQPAGETAHGLVVLKCPLERWPAPAPPLLATLDMWDRKEG